MSAIMERPHPMVQDLTKRAVYSGGIVADPARHGPLVPGDALVAAVQTAVDSVGIGIVADRCVTNRDVVCKWWRIAKTGAGVPFRIADDLLSNGIDDCSAWFDGGELEAYYSGMAS
jgi:hypothetical protein